MMPNNTPTAISVTLPPPELGAMTLIDMCTAALMIVLIGNGGMYSTQKAVRR
jgi:hypothetical protein